jgi:hypothetical protein
MNDRPVSRFLALKLSANGTNRDQNTKLIAEIDLSQISPRQEDG